MATPEENWAAWIRMEQAGTETTIKQNKSIFAGIKDSLQRTMKRFQKNQQV